MKQDIVLFLFLNGVFTTHVYAMQLEETASTEQKVGDLALFLSLPEDKREKKLYEFLVQKFGVPEIKAKKVTQILKDEQLLEIHQGRMLLAHKTLEKQLRVADSAGENEFFVDRVGSRSSGEAFVDGQYLILLNLPLEPDSSFSNATGYRVFDWQTGKLIANHELGYPFFKVHFKYGTCITSRDILDSSMILVSVHAILTGELLDRFDLNKTTQIYVTSQGKVVWREYEETHTRSDKVVITTIKWNPLFYVRDRETKTIKMCKPSFCVIPGFYDGTLRDGLHKGFEILVLEDKVITLENNHKNGTLTWVLWNLDSQETQCMITVPYQDREWKRIDGRHRDPFRRTVMVHGGTIIFCESSQVYLWNLDLQELKSLRHYGVYDVQIDGDKIITASLDGTLGIWRLDSQQLLIKYLKLPLNGNTWFVHSCGNGGLIIGNSGFSFGHPFNSPARSFYAYRCQGRHDTDQKVFVLDVGIIDLISNVEIEKREKIFEYLKWVEKESPRRPNSEHWGAIFAILEIGEGKSKKKSGCYVQ